MTDPDRLLHCVRCGKVRPAAEMAHAHIDGWHGIYCHTDDGQDCYTLSSHERWPELQKTTEAREETGR